MQDAVEVYPISLIIPTFNRVRSLERTINVLLTAKSLPSEVVVVDQSSLEEDRRSNRKLLEALPEKIKSNYYYQKVPSLTSARNRGILLASNDILVFMDDDVDVHKDTFQIIFEFMREESISMVGCIDDSMPEGSGRIGYIFDLKSWKKRNIGHVTASVCGRYPGALAQRTPTEWAMGFCFAVKKHLILEWELKFDEKMTGYAYAEDLDFTYGFYQKSRKAGLDCYLSHKLSVTHLESKEYRTPSKSLTYRFVINRMYIAYKYHMGMRSQIAMLWTNFGHFLMRIISFSKPGDLLRAQIRAFRLRKKLKNGELEENFYN